jgi:nucleoside-diphosphate-sugar epimerase
MILVTGASGYLGRHVLTKLEARGLRYTATSRSGSVGVKCDLTDIDETGRLVSHIQPMTTIHCAALVPKRHEDYQDYWEAQKSLEMARSLGFSKLRGRLVFASSQTVELVASPYAMSKWVVERFLISDTDIVLRLPGLFGLPRRSGVIYYAVKAGVIPESFGPYPAMHVEDAAEYLVRAATMPSDGKPELFSVTYDDPRLIACYGSLGVTFRERVEQFRAQVQEQPA